MTSPDRLPGTTATRRSSAPLFGDVVRLFHSTTAERNENLLGSWCCGQGASSAGETEWALESALRSFAVDGNESDPLKFAGRRLHTPAAAAELSPLRELCGREPRLDNLVGGGRRAQIAGDRGDERRAVELVEHEVGQRTAGRGPHRVAQESDLAERVSGLEHAQTGTGAAHLDSSARDDVERLPSRSLRDHRLAGLDLLPLRPRREPLERRHRQRREQRHSREQSELRLRNARRVVDPAEAPPREEGEAREDAACRNERRPDAQLVYRDRAQTGARCDAGGAEDLEGAEDAAEDVVVDGALEQREPAHVEERVAQADHGERGEGDRRVRSYADQGDGRAPEDEREREHAGEPSAIDQSDGSDGS